MAHLPEPVEDLDESLVSSDPVIRAPKNLVTMPEPASYAMKTVAGIAAVALAIGGSLGAVGIGIVYATRVHPAAHHAVQHNGGTPVDGGSTFALVLGADAGSASPENPTGPGAGLTASHQRLGRGRTLPVALRALGLRNDLATLVIRALRPLLNMRSLQPADVIVVQRDPSNNDIRRVEYRRSETQVWAVTIAADSTCTAEHVTVAKTIERVVSGFVVGDSLEASLHAGHLQPEIVPRLHEVFDAIDLRHELHRGDVVRLIVEEERLNGIFFRYGRMEAVDYRGTMGQRRAFFQRLGPHGGDFFDRQGFSQERGPLRAPLSPVRISSPFNPHRMHPVLHRVMPHMGTDFGAAMGTPVYATAEGSVLTVGSGGPTGNLVRLTHPALGIETGYAHLSRFAPGIHAGMPMRLHQLVGYVGSTGRSTGPHLHLSCKRHDVFFDCQTLYQGRRSVPSAVRSEFDQNTARWTAELDAVRVDGAAPIAPTTETPAVTDAEAPPANEDPTEDNGATE